MAVIGLSALAALSSKADPVAVQETGVGANEIVKIGSSTIGNNVSVYAGVLDLSVNGSTTFGFCIDPWHWSGNGVESYNTEALTAAPKPPGAMDFNTAIMIDQLWAQYFSPTISNYSAAGLQIAIWELVGASVSASTHGASWFALDSSNDYGASADIAWVKSNPNATAANLVALTGPGQDYAVSSASLSPDRAQGSADVAISTTNLAYGSASSYTVPTGANYVIIKAWGAIGYVCASYDVKSGDTFSIKLVGGNGGNTTVTTPYGSVKITGGPGVCSADGSCYNVTDQPSGGPTSPGAGNKYQGYVSIIAMAKPPTITSGTTAAGSLGGNFGYTITSTGGAISYNAAGLPSGLSINTSTGVISGKPTTAGNFSVTLSASNGATSRQALSLSVAPVINSTLAASAKQNEPFSYTVAATGAPTGFSANGLPPGLSINANTGVISGSPTQNGAFNVQICATTSGATGSATLALTITPTYTLTIALSNGQGGTVTGAGVYDPGTTVAIAESANSGFRTGGWGGTDAGSVAAAGSASTSIVMSANRSLLAQFVATGTLTINAAAGGVATGAGTFDVGSVVPITASPTGSNVFTGWSGAGIANVNSANTSITISGNETINAGFEFEKPNILANVVFPNAVSTGQNGIAPTTSSIQVVLSNTGNSSETVSALTISSLTTTGDFQPTVNLPLTIPPGGSASITVTFDPTVLGNRTGVLTAITDSPTSPVIQYDLQGHGVNPNWPPSALVNAPPTAYTLSPLTVSGSAMAPNNNLSLQSIEWQAPGATSWTVNAVAASGGNANQTTGITFPATGKWNVRAGASVDNGATWYYSATQQIIVSSGITNYTLQTMAVPGSGMQNWYASSPVAQKTYQVQHINP